MKQLSFVLCPSLATGQTSLQIPSSKSYLIRTFLFVLFNIIIATAANSQQMNSTQNDEKTVDFMQKSKTQKTWGWILTGAGLAGLIGTMGEQSATQIYVWGGQEEDRGNYTVPYVLSAAAVAGGITLFVAASRNKKRAAASVVYLKMENASALNRLGFYEKPFPSVALRFK